MRAARRAGTAAAALALVLGGAPLRAETVRATLSVTATVVPSCTIAHRGGNQADVACSTGAEASTPELLGAAERRQGRVLFAAAPRPRSGMAKAAPAEQRYLTITY